MKKPYKRMITADGYEITNRTKNLWFIDSEGYWWEGAIEKFYYRTGKVHLNCRPEFNRLVVVKTSECYTYNPTYQLRTQALIEDLKVFIRDKRAIPYGYLRIKLAQFGL